MNDHCGLLVIGMVGGCVKHQERNGLQSVMDCLVQQNDLPEDNQTLE